MELLVTLRSQQLQRLGKSADIEQLAVVYKNTLDKKEPIKSINVADLIQTNISDLTRTSKNPHQ